VLLFDSSRIKLPFAPMQRRSSFWLFRMAAAAEPLTRNPAAGKKEVGLINFDHQKKMIENHKVLQN
jgi:hypothetical protein